MIFGRQTTKGIASIFDLRFRKMAQNFASRSVSVTSSIASSTSSAGRFNLRGPGRNESPSSTQTDAGFDNWRKCLKCHSPLTIPKALACLHTICLHCLRIHYQTIRMQAGTRAQEEPEKYDFYSWEGCFPCPICLYPCYLLPEGLTSVPTNKRLLRLTIKERLYYHIEIQEREQDLSPTQERSQILDSGEGGRDTGAAASKQDYSPEDEAGNEDGDTSPREGESRSSEKEGESRHDSEPEHGDRVTDHSGASAQSILSSVYGLQKAIKSLATSAGCPPSILDSLKENESILAHWRHVAHECKGKEQDLLFVDEDPMVAGHRNAKLLHNYSIKCGSGDLELQHPNAIAVNPHTGHLVVVDTTWNKAVLYKNHQKPFSYKKFKHPIIDVCFCPPTEEDHTERFCAMGRCSDRKGIMVYKAPFNKNPDDFTCMYQKNIRDVSGILMIEPNTLLLSLSFSNTVIHQINEKQFVDLATRKHHGIYYPTHLTYTAAKEVVVADTGNHRIGVFYGPELLAFDFYGEYGSKYGKFFYPMGLAADKDRHLYICDTNNYRVQVFSRFFQFESCPISQTYLMGDCVSQDVKPLDCAVNKQNLIVLFRGRHYMSLQMFQYFEPQFVFNTGDDLPTTVLETVHPSCWCCYVFCSCCCCCKSADHRDRSQYEPIN